MIKLQDIWMLFEFNNETKKKKKKQKLVKVMGKPEVHRFAWFLREKSRFYLEMMKHDERKIIAFWWNLK
jgi:hypothetical protein